MDDTKNILPAGSTAVRLPPRSEFLITHPSEPMKVLTLDGQVVPLPWEPVNGDVGSWC